MRHQELLIGGYFYGGPCDQGIGKALSRSPWDGRSVGTSAEAGWPEVKAAIEAAHDAFPKWRAASMDNRARLLRKIADLIEERKDDLAELLVLEIGKPITLALAELARAKRVFELAARWAEEADSFCTDGGDDPRGAGIQATVVRQAIGPFFCITPYNWPFLLTAHKVAGLIAVGGTAIVKGSPLSPMCSLAMGRLIHEAGCPDGVVNFIQCEPVLAEKAIKDPRIKGVSFTGSEKIGWHLKRTFPEKPVVLELGGDAHAVLMEDSEWEKALPSLVTSAFGYAGQVCISLQHLLVHESIFDQVSVRLTKLVKEASFGNPKLPETLCGPMISDHEAARAKEWIGEAAAMGAQILVGGKGEGRNLLPTLIKNLPEKCRLSTEEAFAPILCLHRFGSLDEAIARINRSRFGIHASLFTRSEADAETFFQRVETQGVVINDVPSLRFDHLPYGGLKASGTGREGIPWSLDEFTTARTKVVRLSSA